ncbi:hypothetical protein GF362_03885 [Candidatus Dojkabacteria bacterium]|nr:hypothetical protein [Candidatus Dojkabacteria bacterium]
MRLWSISLKYLDSKGLVALWREALLAKKVLEGGTVGYRKHPQLRRFRYTSDPEAAINTYLSYVYKESKKRKFKFDKTKVNDEIYEKSIPVRKGQVDFEFQHLLKKLKKRDKKKFEKIKGTRNIEVIPLFEIFPGGIEAWEKGKLI